MDLVGSSVFCSGSCSRSKLLIFVSAQGRRGSELVSVTQENLWAVTDRGCELRAGAPAAGNREEAMAPKVVQGLPNNCSQLSIISPPHFPSQPPETLCCSQ